MGSRSFAVKCEVQHQFDRKNSYLSLQNFHSAKMGVNQSKGSVNITSTPNKGPAVENGKKVDEKIITDEKITDDTTKINGDVEKVTTNGDAKKEEVVEEETKVETTEEKETSEEKETPEKSDDTVEEADAGDKTTSEKKKTSTKDKIKKTPFNQKYQLLE